MRCTAQIQSEKFINIYASNTIISMFIDMDVKCVFCGVEPETVTHLFCHCSSSSVFWGDMEKFVYYKTR